MAKTLSYWEDAPPALDVWAAGRAQAPDVDDHTARHQRGFVRLPWEINPDPGERAGDLVPAWVCCDPACAGVELDPWSLERSHYCCGPQTAVQRKCKARSGRYHGEYTAYWQPA